MLISRRVIVFGIALAVGCGASPQLRTPDSRDKLALGRQVYDLHCRGCHGASGDGQGPAARFLYPRPRDLVHEKYRIRSTVTGSPPADADLLTVLTVGVPGTAMPGFGFLAPNELRAVIEYVKSLSLAVFATAQPVPVEIGAPPPSTPGTIAAGKALYTRLGCSTCHGVDGRGDGELADDLLDARDLPIRCRDLIHDAYKGGAGVRDIYLRLTSGMDGTPMSGVADTTTVAERWQLATYVASLRRGDPPAGSDDRHGGRAILSRRVDSRVPITDPFADRWGQAPASEVPLFPLAGHPSRKSQPARVIVRSLHDRWMIAFRLEWADATRDDRTDGTERFADAAALQFVIGKGDAFLGMGSAQNPVRIWHWRADWQRTLDGQVSPTATAHADETAMPFPSQAAEAAGNPYTRLERSRSVEEGLAAGAGTFTPRSVQRTSGTGTWKHGTWYVVLARELDGGDVSTSSNIKLAVAIWDGAHRDRGGQKAISSWYRVETRE